MSYNLNKNENKPLVLSVDCNTEIGVELYSCWRQIKKTNKNKNSYRNAPLEPDKIMDEFKKARDIINKARPVNG